MRTITVKGTGNASARPDYIILSLNIEVLSYLNPMTVQCRKLPRESKDCKVPQSALGIAKKT